MPDDTTPATQEAASTTPTPVTETQAPDTTAELARLRQELESVRKEAASYRVKAKESGTKAEQAATLESQLAELRGQVEQERQARVTAERKALLTGKVVDPTAALKLLDPDKHLAGDAINVDALLTDFPFLKPADLTPTVTPVKPANAPTAVRSSLTADQIARMTPEEYRANSDEIMKALREGRIQQ
ncbi:MAG TPA: hypothetical protein VHN99_07275 [Deinococcales bacterium]|nr:hypothetical protein [Deinococcales bacterium]